MERTETHPISDDSLKHAIAIKCAACYGALLMCRSLGNAEDTDEWWLVRNHLLKTLLEEADKRCLDLSDVTTSVERQPLFESRRYMHARGVISDEELRRYGRDLSAGRINVDGSLCEP